MSLPRVSVVVPARNEERTILPSLHSLCALDYGNFEVLMVDDRSTDRTVALAAEFIKTYAGKVELRLLAAPSEPPQGWVGKTFAVDYAISHSSGDIILVCDADVAHMPQSLHIVVEHFQKRHLDLLSLLPHFDIRSLGEYPLLFQTFLLYFSSRVVRLLGGRQSFGMGTYLMFTRDFYQRSGGWSAHREYPESLPLINYCIRSGGAFEFLADRRLVTARMHDGAADTFRGLVRNSNPGLLLPLPLMVFVIFVGVFSAALASALSGSVWGAFVVAVMVGLFAAHLVRSRYPMSIVFLASILFIGMPLYQIAVALTVVLRRLFAVPQEWRGRYMRPH